MSQTAKELLLSFENALLPSLSGKRRERAKMFFSLSHRLIERSNRSGEPVRIMSDQERELLLKTCEAPPEVSKSHSTGYSPTYGSMFFSSCVREAVSAGFSTVFNTPTRWKTFMLAVLDFLAAFLLFPQLGFAQHCVNFAISALLNYGASYSNHAKTMRAICVGTHAAILAYFDFFAFSTAFLGGLFGQVFAPVIVRAVMGFFAAQLPPVPPAAAPPPAPIGSHHG
ncbi:MAG: hypothetical protein COV52_00900 [Gammaproteobacteria bacterium CG11_big_fil_rev_8_21_14_0_20_46_22]|nr:MAG: hypothetical protein COW05_03000 [Gammaproteobacteria bacterium CG12_big_fil_rev_8_21_14_0_65_46_12]PIR11975.1 MAG: hypothetical protein COV52_00900 [Gammaproteobacteria bacterium CG11_big_fil_rev_8_21_14_0_20_46_22]